MYNLVATLTMNLARRTVFYADAHTYMQTRTLTKIRNISIRIYFEVRTHTHTLEQERECSSFIRGVLPDAHLLYFTE